MKLQMAARKTERKSDAKKLRRAGQIPAIIYAHDNANGEPIAIKNSEYTSLVRSVQQGRLSTTVFNLVDEKGKERQAIIKDIQYNVTTYDVIHLDFEELRKDVPVNVKVPIEFTGVVDCVGVKLGGVLRQVIRYLRVRCLPRNIPSVFEVDVKSMGLGEYRRLSDLNIPKDVQPLAEMHEIAVSIGRR
jgi:large subunit ribosomal protein L25